MSKSGGGYPAILAGQRFTGNELFEQSPDLLQSMKMERVPPSHLPAILAVIAGLGAFSAMDAVMKSAALAVGVYTAVLLRNTMGTILMLPVWWARGAKMPSREGLRVHVVRAAITAIMAMLFFYGLVRMPIAEAIAVSFIAPLIALYFAALILGEKIRTQAILGSVLGLAGVGVIAAGQFGEGYSTEAIKGMAAILTSAVFYALNLVIQRKQALLAGPIEIATVQNLFVALILLTVAPFFARMPDAAALRDTFAGAVLATLALLFLAWGYARAEAQVLLPIEYTGFLWGALFGWLLFGETITLTTVLGAIIIVVACTVATRQPKMRVGRTPAAP